MSLEVTVPTDQEISLPRMARQAKKLTAPPAAVWAEAMKNDPTQSDQNREAGTEAKARTLQKENFEQEGPNGDGRNQDRGDAGRQSLFGPEEATIGCEKHQRAEDPQIAPLTTRWNEGMRAAPDIEDYAGYEEADAGSEESRQGFDSHADCEIGGTPENVDGGEGKHRANVERSFCCSSGDLRWRQGQLRLKG
jgi:hypothetical protein